jgi:hypothetical protein
MKKMKYIFFILMILILAAVTANIDRIPSNTAEAATKMKAPYIRNVGYDGIYYKILIEADKGSTIYYTIDGTEPNKKSTQYINEFIMEAGKKYTIKAVAYKGTQKSTVTMNTYYEKLNELGKAVKNIIREYIKPGMTDFEKIISISTYFNTVAYDLHGSHCYSARGALVDQRAVCGGFSDGFYVLMNRLGFPCKVVIGDNYGKDIGDHAWNMVKLEGYWYMLDPLSGELLFSDQDFKDMGFYWEEDDYPECSKRYAERKKVLTITPLIMESVFQVTIDFNGLEKIIIQDDNKIIKFGSFWNCKSLKTVELPETIEEIEETAFEGCTSLTTINIPASVKMIRSNAFRETPWLANQKSDFVIVGDGILLADHLTDYSYVKIPDTVKVISGAFAENKGLGEVVIPDSVTKIVGGAFKFSSLGSIIIPDSVTEIGEYAFLGCDDLTNVKLPGNLKKLGYKAFCNCDSLEHIELPEGLESLANDVFSFCDNLTFVTMPGSIKEANLSFYNTPWIENYPEDFIIIGDSVLFKYKGSETTVTVPEGVKYIAYNAFALNSVDIKKVILPSSVIGLCDGAFSCSRSLETVNIPEGVTFIGDYAFFETNIKEITIPRSVKSIGYEAFCNCYNLKTVVIKNGVTSIDDYAFIDSGVNNITIPDSVRKIGLLALPVKEVKKDLKVICNKNSIAYDYAMKYEATIELK